MALLVMLFVAVSRNVTAQSTQNYSRAVSGGGTLQYQITTYGWNSCDSSGSNPNAGRIQNYSVYNFVYVDQNGTSYQLGYGLDFYQLSSDDPSNGCPYITGPRFDTLHFNVPGIAIDLPYSIDDQGYFSAGTPTIRISGFLTPKYVILAVTYAPPGSQSSVTYSNSTSQSVSTSVSKTFTDQTSFSVSMGANANFGIFAADSSVTASTSYTQSKDSSSSIDLSTTSTYGRQIYGPANSALGIDHAFDVIWIWLNPLVDITIPPDQSLSWTGYTYDSRDINEMDIVPLYVSWLQNPQTMPADVVHALARSWDTSGAGGLTTADYATILARDPLLNSSFNPNTDTSGRFDLQSGHDFNYVPPPAGGQPITETYSLENSQTSTTGQAVTDTYQVGLGIDAKLNAGVLIAKVKTEIKIENTNTWVTKHSSQTVDTSKAAASLSITGPASSDNYSGPTRIEVWKDNIYGTFMFYPVN